ncbi:hypothetical protein [Leptospira barantonii]|uniref:YbbD head domain-containing protein n=1 Tax=Leptospira barantonii TaxID=2023184 RepID=A0ABX4NKD7_9LEPT|nr:hypothetical protein [Leptospira barantonii]PJZ57225.1 hypothetical protein CH367_10860 [Leptospira barantonii]
MKKYYLLYLIKFIICILLISCTERISSNFQNYAEMRKSESYLNGWIPNVIPDDAVDIYEVHDLDTNSIFIKFICRDELKFKNLKLINNFRISEDQIDSLKKYVSEDLNISNSNLLAYDYKGSDIYNHVRLGQLLRLKSGGLCFYFDGRY